MAKIYFNNDNNKPNIDNNTNNNNSISVNKKIKYSNSDSESENNEQQQSQHQPLVSKKLSAKQLRKLKRKQLKNVNIDLKKTMLDFRSKLPIWTGRQQLLNAIKENEVTVVLGETGSGKTTQLPQFILESNLFNGKIAITQPRRVAAISLAQRVSQESGTECGSLVGYSVRFDDKSWKGTKLKYVTDGMLMRELLNDQLLTNYDVIIIDEAHERTLRTDLIIGTLKSIMNRRKQSNLNPLKVVIMSATLDAEKFSNFFDKAPILYVKGRTHPVKIYNAKEDVQDYLDGCLKTIFQIHLSAELPGDILVFLPGQEEIQSIQHSIKLYLDSSQNLKHDILTLPLYASLSPSQQSKVFEKAPENTRKVILATNVAETSITISGVKHVIDSGLARERKFYTHKGGVGIDTLFVKPISKSAAMQRAGRAGRESSGYCYRLYTESQFLKLKQSTPPEIERTNLNFAILQLKAISEQTYESFEWLDEPSDQAIQQANISLYGLGALDDKGKISELGIKMAMMPLDPSLSKILLSATENGCVGSILTLCSILSVDSPIFTNNLNNIDDDQSNSRDKFASRFGDHLSLLNVWNSYKDVVNSGSNEDVKQWCQSNNISQRSLKRANDIRNQLSQQCKKQGIDVTIDRNDEESILKCILNGMFQNVAIRQGDGTYKQVMNNQQVKIHPTSCLINRKVPCIMYNELTITTATYARTVSSIHPAWLRSLKIFNQRSR